MTEASFPRRRLQLTQSLKQTAMKSVLRTREYMASIPRISQGEPLPLSFAQQRLWFLQQLEPGSPLYTIPVAWRLSGHIQFASLERSLATIVQRHESLRTVFLTQDGEPRQSIHEYSSFSLPLIDLRGVDPVKREGELRRLLLQESQRSFDLERGPLFHLMLVKMDEAEHILVLSIHHCISDGWSIGVFLRELGALYTADVRGQPALLPDLPIQYTDFSVWQRQWLQGEQLQQQLSYWNAHLQGAATLDLPTDYPRPPRLTFQGAYAGMMVPAELSASARLLSQKNGVTLFMTLLTAFKVLLVRYSGQTDILVGTPIASRTRLEVEGLIGFFANTIVLRTDLSGDISFEEALRRVRHTTLEAYAHQETPFEKVVETLQPERDLSRSPLFQVMFVLQNNPGFDATMADVKVQPVHFEVLTTKFDLTFSVADTSEGLFCTIEYNTALFEQQTMQRMLQHWQILLSQLVQNVQQPIQQACLLSTDEYRYLVETCNATAQPDLDQGLFLERLSAQVQLQPDAVAVCFGDHMLTYAELVRRANQLAHRLQRLGIGPDEVVGLCLPRCLEVLIAILGVFKAGGAYVPLDPTYPQQRLDFMLTDAQVKLVLTQQHLLDKLPPGQVEYLCLDQMSLQLASEEQQPPQVELLPNHLAYIIYTSGTTGRPKGTMITHGGLVNYLSWAAAFYKVKRGLGSAVHSSLSFDLTVTSLFTPLLVGRSVVMVEEGAGVERLAQVIRQYGHLSLLKLTPAHLPLLETNLQPEELACMDATLVIGGEALARSNLENWMRWAPQSRYINEYGPTETVVGCCVYEVSAQTSQSAQISIGSPIKNTQLYVLDANLQPVPIGVIGELYIAGAGVARGYIHRPEVTAERFLPDPFSKEPGKRMYRSGDLARYRAGGTLEFLGRVDHQVKVRGFRVELGEIEARLEEHPMINQVVVLLWEEHPGEKTLVAYIKMATDADQQQLSRQALRAFLEQRLPSYMIPIHFVCLQAFPFTSNGKVDRQALPAPDRTGSAGIADKALPQTPLEKELAAIWTEILGVEGIALEDNFFALGGHSLLGTQLVARIRRAFQVDFPLSALFEAPILADQALFIEDLVLTEIEQLSEAEV